MTKYAIIMFEDDELEEIDLSIRLYNNGIEHCKKRLRLIEYKRDLQRKLPIIYEIGLQKRNY